MKDRELRKFHLLLPVGIGLLIVSVLAGGALLTWQSAQARNLTDSWLNGIGPQTDRLLTAWLDSGWKALEQGGEPVREDEEGKLCTEDGMVYQLVPDAVIPSQRSLMPCLGPDQEPCLALLEWEAGDRLPGYDILPLEGTYLAWMNISRSGMKSDMLAEAILKEGKVMVNPGTMYGPGGEDFIRINLACPRKLLDEGLRRIAGFLDKLPEG